MHAHVAPIIGGIAAVLAALSAMFPWCRMNSKRLKAIDAKLTVLEDFCHRELQTLAQGQIDLAMLCAKSWKTMNERMEALEKWANEATDHLKKLNADCPVSHPHVHRRKESIP